MPGREEEDVAHPQPGRMQSKSEMAPTTLPGFPAQQPFKLPMGVWPQHPCDQRPPFPLQASLKRQEYLIGEASGKPELLAHCSTGKKKGLYYKITGDKNLSINAHLKVEKKSTHSIK